MLKSKLYAIGLLAAVGVAGFAVGAATMSRADTRKSADYRERFSYSGMLGDELGLTTAQRDSIRAITRAHRPAMHALLAPVRPQMDSLRARMRAEIRAVLTGDQQVRFDTIVARERARWDSAAPGRNARTGTR